MVGDQVYHHVFSIALSFNTHLGTSLAKRGVRTLNYVNPRSSTALSASTPAATVTFSAGRACRFKNARGVLRWGKEIVEGPDDELNFREQPDRVAPLGLCR